MICSAVDCSWAHLRSLSVVQGQAPVAQYANGQLTLPSAPPPGPQIKIVLRFANIYNM